MRRGFGAGLLHLGLAGLIGLVIAGARGAESRGASPEAVASATTSAEPPLGGSVAEGQDAGTALSPEGTGAADPEPGPVDWGLGTRDSDPADIATRIEPGSYTIQAGDSLADIAARFGIDVPTLLGSNDLDDPDLLPVGRELKILPVRGVLYTVADGDTLNQIAERYELPVLEIMRANGIDDSELIRPGQELVLPGATPLYARLPGSPEGSPVLSASATRVEAPSVELASAVILPGQSGLRPSLVWPAGGPITTYFGEVGWTSPRGHAGLDIAAPWGAPVRAAAAGDVILATRNGGPYGIQVILDHGGGWRTVYAHLAELHVQAGERVERGQLVGVVGSTGFSTGPHLHFEVRQNGELRDPLGLLP